MRERLCDQSGESFGILLGRIRRRLTGFLVDIVDFEPFDPATLRRRPQAPRGTDLKMVGLYRRRQTETLRLDHIDASLIEDSFGHPAMVYLLLGSGEGPDRAAFFIQERGQVHGYLNYCEFPFDAEFLSGPTLDGRDARRVRWIPVWGLAASLIALCGWFFWVKHDTVSPASESTPPPAVAEQAAPPIPEARRQVPESRSEHPPLKRTSKRRKHVAPQRHH